MFYNAKEKLLEIQDIQMNYITFGKGEKPLILIQGLSTRSIKGVAFSVAYMYRMFARDYKVYLFDRRENISDGITVRDLAADIAMAMDTLKITNADIFGVSQGGMIAQYLAIDRPDLVNQLVLAVTLSKNNETVERTVNDWIHITEQNNMKRLITDMAEKMYSDIYVKRYKPFMALLRACNIPCRVHGFTIDKELQKGAMTGIVYKNAPQNVFHSWVEVYFEDKWYELEAFILDMEYLRKLQRKNSHCTGEFCGYGVAVKDFKNPIIDFDRNNTYIQSEGINQDFGVYDSPDDLLKEHHQEMSVIKAFLYRNLGRHLMNRNVNKIRNS